MKNKILFLILICFTLSGKAQGNFSIEDLYEIGYKMDSTLTAGDATYVNNLYDKKAFSEKFILKEDNKKIKKFNKGFYKGFFKKFNFGNIILGHINKGSTYDFIHASIDNNNYNIMFRLYGEGVNYHKHTLKNINGELKIVDSYIYLTGENLSDTFGNIYRSFFNSRGLKSNKVLQNEVNDLTVITIMKRLINEGKHKEALAEFKKVSKQGKEKKIFLINKILAASNVSDEIYKEVIEEYEIKFPNDPSLYLVSIDGLIIAEKFDEALINVNKLDEAIGGDDFLNLIRGNIKYAAKDYKKAIEFLNLLSDDYPDFLDAYDSLLTVYIESNNNKKAIETLEVFKNRFEASKEDLIDVIKESFFEFSKTEEFINWTKKD